MIIIWDSTVSLPDDQVTAWARKIAAEKPVPDLREIRIGTDAMLNALRVEIKRGEIPFETVQIVFKDESLKIDKNARIDNWPDGFADVLNKQLDELLKSDLETEKLIDEKLRQQERIRTEKNQLLKENAIRLVERHKATCEGVKCNISLCLIADVLRQAGIQLTEQERGIFM